MDEWAELWYAVDQENLRRAWEFELRTEVCIQHPLANQSVRLIARRRDRDDALFLLEDGEAAEVHLNWSRRPEHDPRWPSTMIFASLDEWRRTRMAADHAEWEAENE